MGFSRQEYWSGCRVLLYRIFLTQESNGCLLCLLHWQVSSLTLAPPGNHVDLYNRRFIVEIDSHEHKGFEKLHCAYCKLENQDNKWNNSVWVQRPENQEIQHWRAGGPGYPSSKKIEWIHPPFTFLFYSGPKWIEWCPQALVKTNIFYSLYWLNTNVFSKHVQSLSSLCLCVLPPLVITAPIILD